MAAHPFRSSPIGLYLCIGFVVSACGQSAAPELRDPLEPGRAVAGATSITNGGFESGTTSWTSTGSTTTSTTAHSGVASGQAGSKTFTTTSTLAQGFTVPAGGATLSFWYQGNCNDTVSFAWATATLADSTAGTTATLLPNTCTLTGTWVKVTSAALTAGHAMLLTLTNKSESFNTDYNFTLFDDVVLTPNAPANDFSLTATPAAATVAAGAATTVSIATALTSGTAQTITLAASGLPAGVTASFTPASVTAGGSSTLTLTAAATAASATATVTVTGTATSGSHAAGVALTVTGAASTGGVTNGGFESGLTGWTATGADTTSTVAHSGAASAMLGNKTTGTPSTLAQTFTMPAAGGAISFWYQGNCNDTVQFASFSAALVDNTAGTTMTVLGNTCTLTTTWAQATSPAIPAGHSVTLTFTNASEVFQTNYNFTLVDDVTIAAPVAGVGPNGGTVDHLFFAVIGDTRPGNIDDTVNYPTAIIGKIFQDLQAMSPRPQFVIATGDFMYANTTSGTAQPQLSLYASARNAFTGTLFPAMGNHECDGFTADNCTSLTQTQNIVAYMSTLVTPIGKSLPYYSIPVNATDGSWTAKLVTPACNFWSTTQQTWLTQQLTTPTTYTILFRHEPADATTGPCVNAVETLMTQHPYNLSLVGHTHTFQLTGKEVIVGNGGAPQTAVPYGYATVERLSTGWQVKQYDYSTGLPVNTFLVP